MPTIPHETLTRMLEDIYQAKGVSPEEAAIVTRHQVTADLVGHGSHGVMRTPRYVGQIDRGEIVPGASFDVERSSPTTAVIDANWGFGFVQTERAMNLAIEMAGETGVGAVTIRYQGHIGRLGTYAQMAADQGMIGLLAADSGRGPKAVAPFGSSEARLGTNPICLGVPRASGPPAVLDMATSAVAAGKVAVARSREEPMPKGWVVGPDGEPTTDPNAYYDGGALLPLGGDQGHKGYGLSFMVEILCGLLTGLGFGVAADGRHNDGCFLAVFNIAHFRDRASFLGEVDDFVDYIKASKPARGFTEVLYPGEMEARSSEQRLQQGIPVDDNSWSALSSLVDELGVSRDGMDV